MKGREKILKIIATQEVYVSGSVYNSITDLWIDDVKQHNNKLNSYRDLLSEGVIKLQMKLSNGKRRVVIAST